MIKVFEILTTGTGFGVDVIILIIVTVLGLLFYSRGVKIGLIMHMLAFGLLAMLFYAVDLYFSADWDFKSPLWLMLICLILLALSLIGKQESNSGGLG